MNTTRRQIEPLSPRWRVWANSTEMARVREFVALAEGAEWAIGGEPQGPVWEQAREWHRHYEAAGIPVEIRAAWVLHRMTSADSDGARMWASTLLVRGGLFPLIVRDHERRLYLEALRAPDEGPLVERIRAMQRREMLRGLRPPSRS